MPAQTITRKQRAALARAEHETQRAALVAQLPHTEAPTPNSAALARAAARAQLSENVRAHVQRQRAARILDEQQTERRAVSAARSDAAEQLAQRSAIERAGNPRPNVEALAAARRDQYRAALRYPMLPAEVLAAALAACEQARVPAGDSRDETISELVRVVIRRHGPQPMRCEVGARWLRQWALRIWQREETIREHRTGMRAAHEQLNSWRSEDLDLAQSAGDTHPDRVYFRAMGLPAPEPDADARPETAAQLAATYSERLCLTAAQGRALVLALQSRQRVTLKLSSAENMAASRARATLRKRYPSQSLLTAQLRPGALEVTASREALTRASVAASGSHLPGQRDSASTGLLARWQRFPVGALAAARRVSWRMAASERRAARAAPVGPQSFSRYGNGYGGACSVLYLYRSGPRRSC